MSHLVGTSLVLVQARLTSSEGFTVLELDEYELVSDLNQVFLGLLENQRNLKKEGRSECEICGEFQTNCRPRLLRNCLQESWWRMKQLMTDWKNSD